MKMKMNFKYAMMAFAALSMGMASCSDDPAVDGGTDLNGSEESFITISLGKSNVSTRAVKYYEATAEEEMVHNARVYVFSPNKVLQQVIDLEENSGAWSKKFKATVGKKYFIAVANAPSVNVPVGTGLDNLIQTIEGLTQKKFEAYLDPEGSKGTGFFMSTGINTDELSSEWYKAINYVEETIYAETEVDDKDASKDNKVVIPIGRAMAKVSVQIGTGLVRSAYSSTGVKLGEIVAPEYSVANNPSAMYYFPFFTTLEKFQTPLYNKFDSISAPRDYWPALHAANFGDPTVYGNVPTGAAGTNGEYYGYRPTCENNADSAKVRKSAFYAVENYNDYPTYGNATIAQVKTTFKPADFDGAPASYTGALTATTDGTFYRIWDSTTEKFHAEDKSGFWSASDAEMAALLDAIKGDAGIDPTDATQDQRFYLKKYDKGICYYLIPLRNTYFADTQRNNDPEVYSVMRNHFYDVRVTKITDCGYHTPGGKDEEPGPGDETEPEDPLDPDGTPFIEVEIEVIDWVWVSQNEEIGIR